MERQDVAPNRPSKGGIAVPLPSHRLHAIGRALFNQLVHAQAHDGSIRYWTMDGVPATPAAEVKFAVPFPYLYYCHGATTSAFIPGTLWEQVIIIWCNLKRAQTVLLCPWRDHWCTATAPPASIAGPGDPPVAQPCLPCAACCCCYCSTCAAAPASLALSPVLPALGGWWPLATAPPSWKRARTVVAGAGGRRFAAE